MRPEQEQHGGQQWVVLLVAWGSMLLDQLSFAVVLPVVPRLFEGVGLSKASYGLITAAYSATVFLCSPALGSLSDRFGRVTMLVLSTVASGLGCQLTAVAQGPTAFAVGRILPGVVKCHTPLCQAYVGDISAPEDRAKNFGTLMSAFAVAFVVGPYLGGQVAEHYGVTAPLNLSTVLCALNVVLILLFMKEKPRISSRSSSGGGSDHQANPRRSNTMSLWRNLVPIFSDLVDDERHLSKIKTLLHYRVAYSLGQSVFETMFAQMVRTHYDATGSQIGLLLSFIGISAVVVNKGLVGAVQKRIAQAGAATTRWAWLRSEAGFQFMLAAGEGIGLLWLGFAPTLWGLLPPLALITLCYNLFGNLNNAQMLHFCAPEASGAVMGFSHAAQRLARIMAPGVGGFVLQHGGPVCLALLSAAFAFYCCGAMFLTRNEWAVGDGNSGAGVGRSGARNDSSKNNGTNHLTQGHIGKMSKNRKHGSIQVDPFEQSTKVHTR